MNFKKIIDLVIEASKFIADENLINTIKNKCEIDFVTEADIKINDFLKSEFKKIDNTIGFFTEEECGQLTAPCWIIDPIDGTTNLIYGYKMCSISVGLFFNGEIQFSVVYNPFSKELFSSEKGKGAFLWNKRLHVSSRNINKSLIEIGIVSKTKKYADISFDIAKNIYKDCLDIRRVCSAALDLCYIADSRLDGYFEIQIEPWDIAAGSLILTEAGGKITCFDGDEIQFSQSTSVIASNNIIHGYLQKSINTFML